MRRIESLQARRGEIEPFAQLGSKQKRSFNRRSKSSRLLHENSDKTEDTSRFCALLDERVLSATVQR